jgi:hypothetical protein
MKVRTVGGAPEKRPWKGRALQYFKAGGDPILFRFFRLDLLVFPLRLTSVFFKIAFGFSPGRLKSAMRAGSVLKKIIKFAKNKKRTSGKVPD